MRPICVALVLCCLLDVSHADERASSLISSFKTLCVGEQLDFAKSEAKAAAMGLALREDLQRPPENGVATRAKVWVVHLKTGEHEFVIAESRKESAQANICGIAATDVRGHEFRPELVAAMKLGPPTSDDISTDGNRVTRWPFGSDGLNLQLQDLSPRLEPSIHLYLILRPK